MSTIRPFTYRASDAELDDLRRRLLATRLPEKETTNDLSQGVPLATMQKVTRYWATEYDWRKVEAKLNSFPQFVTQIDGLDIHFIHVRSRHPNALPLLVTHGWPGTILHNLKIIDPLTNPTAYGVDAAHAFDVVIPSMPGYGFSGKPATTGWDPPRIARAWDVLMKRIAYTHYVAQGGDWGAIITDLLAAQAPAGLLGMHTNMPGVVPPEIDAAAWANAPTPAGLSVDEEVGYEMLAATYKDVHYALLMASRPQTLSGLSDSPVGLATFILDFDRRLRQLMVRTFEGERTGLTRDDVLDNITLYWLTNTAVSAARLYRENKVNYFAPKGVAIPAAVSVFPDELYVAPRSWAEKAYPQLIHFNKLHKGGHFPAWEQPELFTQELRTAFKPLRASMREAS
jgi:pimeloyl-ACP methyl ester carboxylesterase